MEEGLFLGLSQLTAFDASFNRISEIEPLAFTVEKLKFANIVNTPTLRSSVDQNQIICCPSSGSLRFLEDNGIPFICTLDDNQLATTYDAVFKSCGQCTQLPRLDNQCGPTANFARCREGFCCSAFGHCGQTYDHCKNSLCGEAETCTQPVRPDGRCGRDFNNANCIPSECCSPFGYCGDEVGPIGHCNMDSQCPDVDCDPLPSHYQDSNGFCRECTSQPNCVNHTTICVANEAFFECTNCSDGYHNNTDGYCIKNETNNGLSTTEIVVIVVCSVAAILILLGLFVFWHKKRQAKLIDGMTPKEWVNDVAGTQEPVTLQSDQEYMEAQARALEKEDSSVVISLTANGYVGNDELDYGDGSTGKTNEKKRLNYVDYLNTNTVDISSAANLSETGGYVKPCDLSQIKVAPNDYQTPSIEYQDMDRSQDLFKLDKAIPEEDDYDTV